MRDSGGSCGCPHASTPDPLCNTYSLTILARACSMAVWVQAPVIWRCRVHRTIPWRLWTPVRETHQNWPTRCQILIVATGFLTRPHPIPAKLNYHTLACMPFLCESPSARDMLVPSSPNNSLVCPWHSVRGIRHLIQWPFGPKACGQRSLHAPPPSPPQKKGKKDFCSVSLKSIEKGAIV